jgi:hypothetical protein
LQDQPFEFFAVDAKTVQESLNGHVTVINQKNDHCLCGACDKHISEAIRRDKERLGAQKKHDEKVRQCLALEKIEKVKRIQEATKRQATKRQAYKQQEEEKQKKTREEAVRQEAAKQGAARYRKESKEIIEQRKYRKEAAEIKDQARTQEEIEREIRKILKGLSSEDFLALTVSERAELICYRRTHHSSCTRDWWFLVDIDSHEGGKTLYEEGVGECSTDCFVSARVNQILWGIQPATTKCGIQPAGIQPTIKNWGRQSKKKRKRDRIKIK